MNSHQIEEAMIIIKNAIEKEYKYIQQLHLRYVDYLKCVDVLWSNGPEPDDITNLVKTLNISHELRIETCRSLYTS